MHINDNTKLSLNDYRELIYHEINQSKILTNHNSIHNSSMENKSKIKTETKKKDGHHHRSKQKHTPTELSEHKFHTF